MSTLAELYHRSWKTERSADGLERFLAQHPDLNVGQLVEVLLADQTLEWQHEQGPMVEQYLERFPLVADGPQSVLELVCGEMRAMFTLRLSVDVDSYIARFPDFAEPLRRHAEVLLWMALGGTNTKHEPRPLS